MFTSTSGTQPAPSAVPAERAWEALAGARSRFLAAAPARDCLQHCDCAWRRMASDRSSQAIPVGFQASRPIRSIWGHRALRWRGASGVVLLSGKPPKAKTFEPARLPAVFFFSTLVKYSLFDPIIKYTNMRTQPCTGPANNSVQVPEIKHRSSTGCAVKVHKLGKFIIPICYQTSSK